MVLVPKNGFLLIWVEKVLDNDGWMGYNWSYLFEGPYAVDFRRDELCGNG